MGTENNPKTKMFLDIPNAAELAGFSERHFRKIIVQDHFRIVKIRGKFFILGEDLERWQAARKLRV